MKKYKVMREVVMIFIAIVAGVTPVMSQEAGSALVFGGSGRLGAPIVAELIKAHYSVTVLVRSASDRSRIKALPVLFVVGDLLDAQSMRTALDGKSFDLVIDASARGASKRPFYAVAMRNILDALDQPAVTRFILHGSVGAGNSADKFPEDMFRRMQRVMEAKTEAEQMLQASGMSYTIIRNGMIKRDGTPATGKAVLSEDIAAFSAVTRLDLARLTMQCVGNEACDNKIFHAVDASLSSTF